MPAIHIDAHPELEAAAFLTTFDRPLLESPTPPELLAFFGESAEAHVLWAVSSNDAIIVRIENTTINP